MTDVVAVAVIVAGGTIVQALVSGYAGIMSRRVELLAAQTLEQTKTTHTEINSRMTELLEISRRGAHDAGYMAGEQAQRDRMAPPERAQERAAERVIERPVAPPSVVKAANETVTAAIHTAQVASETEKQA